MSVLDKTPYCFPRLLCKTSYSLQKEEWIMFDILARAEDGKVFPMLHLFYWSDQSIRISSMFFSYFIETYRISYSNKTARITRYRQFKETEQQCNITGMLNLSKNNSIYFCLSRNNFHVNIHCVKLFPRPSGEWSNIH